MVWGFESPPAHHKFIYSREKTMAVNVETLEKLERKMTLTLPVNVIQSKSTARLKRWPAPSRWTAFVPARCR
jgi:hypothetical protein